MDHEIILNKIEKVFEEVGFKSVIINGIKYMNYKECYCKLTFLEGPSAFVIESTDNIKYAEMGVLEDGDWYYINTCEKEMLNQLKKDLLKYYI